MLRIGPSMHTTMEKPVHFFQKDSHSAMPLEAPAIIQAVRFSCSLFWGGNAASAKPSGAISAISWRVKSLFGKAAPWLTLAVWAAESREVKVHDGKSNLNLRPCIQSRSCMLHQRLVAALPHTATDRHNIGQCLPGSPASRLTDLTVAASSKRHNQSPAIVHGGHFRKSPRQRRKALGRPGRYSEELSVPRSSTFSAHSTLLPKPAVSLQLSSALQSHAVALKLFGNPTNSPCAMSLCSYAVRPSGTTPRL